jgi:thiosulfate dehydrogenase [quinone] large subunit
MNKLILSSQFINMSPYQQSFLLARLAVGTSAFGHGLVRLPKLDKFSHGMAAEFQHSILPQSLVLGFGYFLPFAEFGIGLLMLLGLLTRPAAIAGSLLMTVLIFGTTTVEKFENIPSMLLHVLFFIGVLVFVDRCDNWSLDRAFGLRKTGGLLK